MEELQLVNLFNPSRILGSRYVIIVIDKGLDLDLTSFFQSVLGLGMGGPRHLPAPLTLFLLSLLLLGAKKYGSDMFCLHCALYCSERKT